MKHNEIIELYDTIIKLYKDNSKSEIESFKEFLPKAFVKTCFLILNSITKETNYKDFGFSINYYSEKFKGERFDISINNKTLRTFVFNRDPESCDLGELNLALEIEENDIVRILNEFYNKNNDDEFSIKEFFASPNGREIRFIAFETDKDKICIKCKNIDSKTERIEIRSIEEFKTYFKIEDKKLNFENYFNYIKEKLFQKKLYQYNFSLYNQITKKNLGNLVLTTSIILAEDKLDLIHFIGDYIISRIAEMDLNISIKNANIKSAIAAIMARNMSHNLGSHVFFYVRDEIIKLADNGEKEDPLVSTHKGLAKFLHYVQERQDFVATITSQDEYFMGPLNLKLDVLDELTPDAVDFRHNSEPPSTNFLLKYLVNSEYIERKSPRGYNVSKNKEIEIAIKFQGDTFKSKCTDGAVKFYDINLAVQGGQQSRHAFLIIIENIIRNAAKHGFDKENSNLLEIQINIEEKDGYVISISDNCGNGEIAAEKIRSQLMNLKILGNDSSQSIDRENKGLKEIVVCVAWLKKIQLSQVFNNERGICNNLLDINIREKNLCYEFTLPKFELIIPINKNEFKKLQSEKSLIKYANIFEIAPELYKEGLRYFPRCVEKNPNGTPEVYWEQLSRKRYGTDRKYFPVIIFERSEVLLNKQQIDYLTQDLFIQTPKSNFLFVNAESEIEKVINKLDNRDYILFKNHLAKSNESIAAFYSRETAILGSKKPLITESISGANFSFNLYQLARNENKKPELYYRIIEAYFTKIVIIDERLCPVETDFADELLHITSKNCNLFVNKYISKDKEHYTKKLQKILENEFDVSSIKYQLEEWWTNINKNDKKKIEQSDSGKLKLRYYNEKNIYMYTMDKLGYLFDSAGGRLDSLTEVNPHFLSIHISLLDKLTKFEEDPTVTTKQRLVHILRKLAVKDHTYISVHSGRGGLTDRNQEVTFIPFANLQWALENSKYMLSELFHSQIYLPINQN